MLMIDHVGRRLPTVGALTTLFCLVWVDRYAGGFLLLLRSPDLGPDLLDDGDRRIGRHDGPAAWFITAKLPVGR